MEAIKHPKSIINNRKLRNKYTDDDLVAQGVMYLQDQASKQPTCVCISKRTPKDCDCLRRFSDLDYDYCVSVAKYMVFYASKPKLDQQMIVIDWIRYARYDNTPRRFLTPRLMTRQDRDNFQGHDDIELNRLEFSTICNSALMTILGYGQTFWNNLNKHATQGTVPSHGLLGRSNNSMNEEMQMTLHYFFCTIESHAEPTPMRFIREKTGLLHERDLTDKLFLPPYFSKRSLYRRYCSEQGWTLSFNSKGSPIKKVTRDDDEWNNLGQLAQPICSWATFLNFWKFKYSHLIVGKASEDVCNSCHKYCNALKFKKEGEPVEEDDDDDHQEEEQDNLDADEDYNVFNLPVSTIPNIAINDSMDLLETPLDVECNEKIILEAETHVKAAICMREYANNKMKEARIAKDIASWADSKDCLVADYCQNLSLPHQGMTQPGETYYYSPLTVNCFGTADAGYEKHQMRAYVYHEGEGKKGGNNVASLLYKDLNDRGWIDLNKGPRDELTVIMDNCAGQNKYRMVLRMMALIHELGLYNRINIAFLVAGHTKNVCDRLFNLLKYVYRKTDVFLFDQLVSVLNNAEDVTAVHVEMADFKDWDGFEDQIYNPPKSGTVHKTHLFMFDNAKPGIIRTQETADPNSPWHEQQLRKKLKGNDRDIIVRDYKLRLKTMTPPGIPAIKQWELWSKWRAYVPQPFKDILCPRPNETVFASMEQKNRDRYKKAEEKRRQVKRNRAAMEDDHKAIFPGTSNSMRLLSPQTRRKESDGHTAENQMTLDSVTTTLNPTTPS